MFVELGCNLQIQNVGNISIHFLITSTSLARSSVKIYSFE